VFFAHLKNVIGTLLCVNSVVGNDLLLNTYISYFQVRGTHHQVEKIISFCSNNVDLFILTCFFNRNQNLICHKPLSSLEMKTAMNTTMILLIILMCQDLN